MFKNIIAPVQAWLLSQGKCVGCGKQLPAQKNKKAKLEDEFFVTCECSRIFVFNEKTGKFRRAKFEEL